MLWCRVTCLEYESQFVAWRKDRLVTMVISRVSLATKPSQNLFIVEKLEN